MANDPNRPCIVPTVWEQIGRASDEPICAFDTSFRLIAFNAAHNREFSRVNGFETRIGDVFPDLFVGAQRPAMRRLMARALTGEHFTVVEEFGNPEIAAPRWEIAYAPLRDARGDVVGAFHRARDLTDRNAKASLELQLLQSQKMEAVGQLTGGLAHDFNNLLASLSGNLQLVRKRLARGQTDDLERRVDAGLESVRRAATLTQRLLAFSRQQTLQATPTDISRLVYGMEALIEGAMGPSVALDVRCSATLWAADVDRSQLENALLNLCINARDAMAPRPGTLTITTGNETVDPQVAATKGLRPGEFVLLSVSDTGSGIPEAIRARVFDPFFTTKPMGEGTGLGLSMVYGFVRQSGGQVRIESEVGHGTTMSLYFPRLAGPEPADAPSVLEPAKASAGNERILFVEDDDDIRSLLGEILRDEGYAVVEAGDGAAALRSLDAEAPIDLLLTDVGLPGGMNGRQLADAARVARPGLKVLFLTGYVENADSWSGRLDAGMQVMTKPFEIPELLNKLREIVAPGSGSGRLQTSGSA